MWCKEEPFHQCHTFSLRAGTTAQLSSLIHSYSATPCTAGMHRPSPGLHRRSPITGCAGIQLEVSASTSGRGMKTPEAGATNARRDFVDALALFRSDQPIGIISHNDADG